MITIVLSACLISDPKVCQDYTIPLNSNWDSTRCAMYAPPFFARWEADHPKWRVVRWHCKPGVFEEL